MVDLMRDSKRTAKKLIAIFALMSLFGIGFVVDQVCTSRTREIEDLRHNVENYAKLSEEALYSMTESIYITLAHIGSEIEAKPAGYFVPSEDLRRHRDRLNRISTCEIRIVGKNGDLVQASDPVATKVNFVDREFFKAARDNPKEELIVSEPIFGRIRNKWLIVFARPLHDPKGEFRGLIFASVETDAFQQQFERLKLSKNDLFTIVSGRYPHFAFRAPLGEKFVGQPFTYHKSLRPVVIDGQHSGVYDTVSVNDGVRRMIGINRIGDYPLMILIGKDIDQALVNWRRDAAIYVALTVAMLAIAWFALLSYLTSQERILQQKLQLASRSQLSALGEMAAAVAHEINSPLSIIKGRAEIIRDMLVNGGDAVEMKANLTRIEATVDRIARIVRGLRSFSRDAEQDPMQKTALEPIVNDVIEICQERFRVHGVALKCVIPSGLHIMCRPAQIGQVLLNLLNNAHDAVKGQPGAWVEIEAKETVSGGRRAVSLTVTDSGSGIPKAVAEKMMVPFFTTKEVGVGTGLGLSVSLGIVQKHGGKLTYDAKSDHTRFVVELPSAA